MQALGDVRGNRGAFAADKVILAWQRNDGNGIEFHANQIGSRVGRDEFRFSLAWRRLLRVIEIDGEPWFVHRFRIDQLDRFRLSREFEEFIDRRLIVKRFELLLELSMTRSALFGFALRFLKGGFELSQ